jgi:hypothetical protein
MFVDRIDNIYPGDKFKLTRFGKLFMCIERMESTNKSIQLTAEDSANKIWKGIFDLTYKESSVIGKERFVKVWREGTQDFTYRKHNRFYTAKEWQRF